MVAEYIHLVGAETVERASWNMQAAADEFHRSAGNLDQTLYDFLRRFEELVSRLEDVAHGCHKEEHGE